ncbi:hypothetical protein L873DRAFT_1787208 [Choiromyces venosus 120613-1]|uniref:Uncharacterized protein n=1 Tax=Choiromyces venosus 120613-1 TaxID=1336337 RepID=A0A3N4JXV5_9PEZI|nr:hypothetical protein L873DRAFT_1787208 [Choiromyces venosus 120613-1]
MATFRSKEDGAKDQIPLHRFQERIGAFRALVHMIANRMDMESSVFEKFQLSLGKLEQDIDQMISDAKTYEDNQGMKVDLIDNLQKLKPTLPMGTSLTQQEALRWKQDYEPARQNNVQKRKQKRVRDFLTSLNRLSAGLLAAISMSERQLAVLQDLNSVLSTSFRTKTKDYEKRYPLSEPFLQEYYPDPYPRGKCRANMAECLRGYRRGGSREEIFHQES